MAVDVGACTATTWLLGQGITGRASRVSLTDAAVTLFTVMSRMRAGRGG
jgi:hypothetical protein